MINLTDRQIRILKAIVEEYMETADPVGSQTLDHKYKLEVSPATIRNEMVTLTKEGFLKKAHSSSGRSPTPMALKYYVNHLMREQSLSATEEVSTREKVWDCRNQADKFFREITKELANRTHELAITTTSQGNMYTAGVGNILDAQEFFDIDLTKALLSHLDEIEFWQMLVERHIGDDPMGLLIGNDLGNDLFEPCGYVYSRFQTGPITGTIGVVGPARLNYGRVYPTLKYFNRLINELLSNW